MASCGSEDLELKADIPARAIDKYEESDIVPSGDAGGHDRYRVTYWVVIEQCEREDTAETDKNGCIVAKTDVSDAIYADYEWVILWYL